MTPTTDSIVIKFIVGKIISAVSVKFPILGAGPVGFIFSYLVTQIVKVGLVDTKILVIQIEKPEDRKNFDEKKDLYDSAVEKGDPNEIQKTEQDLIDGFRDHIKFN